MVNPQRDEMTMDGERLDFARRVLEAFGAKCVCEGGTLTAELSFEQLCALEGRPAWALFGWLPDGENRVVLRLRSDGDDPDAEPLVPGGQRLEQLCSAALRHGAVGRAYIVPDNETTPLRPYLIFHFLVVHVGHDVRERIDAVAVDLVNGDAFLSPPLTALPLKERGDGRTVERPRLTVGEAHERAVDELCRRIADEDASWYHEKMRWIEDEVERLYAYLQRARSDYASEEDLAAVRDARLFELRQLNRPRVEVRAVAATVLYASPAWPKPSATY